MNKDLSTQAPNNVANCTVTSGVRHLPRNWGCGRSCGSLWVLCGSLTCGAFLNAGLLLDPDAGKSCVDRLAGPEVRRECLVSLANP